MQIRKDVHTMLEQVRYLEETKKASLVRRERSSESKHGNPLAFFKSFESIKETSQKKI